MTRKDTIASPHWSDDDLLMRLYGLEPDGARHPVDSCADCAARWRILAERREAVLAPPPVSDDRLRAQRLAVFARIEAGRPFWLWRTVPATALALLLAAGVALHGPNPPAPAPEVAVADISDSQLFSEVAQIAEQYAPAAAEPLSGLFSETASQEVK
jgi:hypothetical protein